MRHRARVSYVRRYIIYLGVHRKPPSEIAPAHAERISRQPHRASLKIAPVARPENPAASRSETIEQRPVWRCDFPQRRQPPAGLRRSTPALPGTRQAFLCLSFDRVNLH